MQNRKLNRNQILRMVEMKKTMTWIEVAAELSKEIPGGITPAACAYWSRRLRAFGHTITKQKAMEPIDLTPEPLTPEKNDVPLQ